MALGVFVAGRYSGTFDSADVGITGNGYNIQQDTELEAIAETDAYGLSVIDGVFRGGQCFCDYSSKEYKAGSLAATWPYGGTIGGAGVLGILINPGAGNTPIGILASDLAKAFVLTSTAGTPAATSPATLTGTLALLAANSNLGLMFNSKLREVPTRLRFYPDDVGGGVIKFFTLT